jgi:aminoglycoside phosphotransferase (APT) family kinase protein
MGMAQIHGAEDLTAHEHEIIEGIIRRLFKTHISYPISFLGAGSCNTNYLVNGADERLVVKLSKPEREYKAAAEYKKEKWCLDQAHRLTIPSPQVLEVGEDHGRVYMIQSYVEGTTAADVEDLSPLVPEAQLQIWRRLGEYARKIHGVAVIGWGEELEVDGTFTGSWSKHLQYNIDCLTDNDPLIAMGVLTPSQSKALKKVLLALQQKPFTFGLNHGDLALRNVIVGTDSDIYLLDWGTARAEIVPHFDINEILRSTKPDPETLQAFLDGYGIAKEEFAAMKPDLNTLNILHEVDTLRWAIDRMPSVIQEHAVRVKEALLSAQSL